MYSPEIIWFEMSAIEYHDDVMKKIEVDTKYLNISIDSSKNTLFDLKLFFLQNDEI